MKALIITFSLTGYTKKTGELIREGFIESGGGECELVDMADVDTGKLNEYDLVGIGCPVYYYQEPFHVRDFLKGLPDLNGQCWFVFCSHGSVMGVTLNSMAGILQEKGAVITGYYDIYADACAPFVPVPTYTTGHPDDSEYDDARKFGRGLAVTVPRIMNGEAGLIPQMEEVPEEWSNLAEMMTPEFVKSFVPQFEINKDKCVECGECEDKCPVRGIDVHADPPRVQKPCIYCCNCVMVCPELAIEADWSGMVRMNPAHYAHLREWLDRAEKEGKFRWLIDPDSIDFDDCMIYQRMRKHKGQGYG